MHSLDSSILSILIFLPLVGALLIADARVSCRVQRAWRSLLIQLRAFHSIIAMGLSAPGGFRFEQKMLWLPQAGISYHLGMDGISLLLILLTTFLTPLCHPGGVDRH